MVTMVASQKRKKAKKSMSGIAIERTVPSQYRQNSVRFFGRFAAELGVQVHSILGFFVIGAGAAKKQAANSDHGGAFENGRFKVVAHAHAQVAKQISADFLPL